MKNIIVALSALVLGSLGCDVHPLRTAHGIDAGISSKTDTAPLLAPDALFAPDALVPADTLSAKPDAQVAVGALPAKTDALVSQDTRPNSDTQIVKTDGQGTTDVQIVASGNIYMSIAIDNPAGMNMYKNTKKVNLLKVTVFGNGLGTSATFRRLGVGQVSDWGNLYLYDSDTLLMSGSISPATNEVTFPGLLFRVNGLKSLILKGDLRATAVAGDMHYFSLDSADKVVSDAKVSGTFPIVGNTFTVSGLQRPEATDASPLPDAQLTPDTQTAKTDLVPDTQPNPDALADIAPTIKTPVIWIEGATDGNGPFDGILVANTHDNTVMRTTFTPVDPTKTYLFTRTTVQVGDPKSYSIVQSVRQYDGSGTLFCSGAIDANGQLRCSNDYGSFAVKGPTTISTKVNLEQIDPVLGTKSGTTLTLAFFVDKTVASNQNGALEAMDSDGNKFHASDFFTDSNWSEARLFGPTMVIYMTEPTVATIANKANLVNGTQSFYEFSETAASNGDVGQKQYTVAVNAIGIGSIFGAQLFVNGSLYDKASIAAFVGKDSVDIKSAVMENPPSVFRIVVTADDKFTVSAKTTKTFDLRVAVSGVHAGSVLKSWLMDDQINPDIGTIASHPDNAFLWSDCSDGCTELSADWIGGRLVKTIPTTPTFLAL